MFIFVFKVQLAPNSLGGGWWNWVTPFPQFYWPLHFIYHLDPILVLGKRINYYTKFVLWVLNSVCSHRGVVRILSCWDEYTRPSWLQHITGLRYIEYSNMVSSGGNQVLKHTVIDRTSSIRYYLSKSEIYWQK